MVNKKENQKKELSEEQIKNIKEQETKQKNQFITEMNLEAIQNIALYIIKTYDNIQNQMIEDDISDLMEDLFAEIWEDSYSLIKVNYRSMCSIYENGKKTNKDSTFPFVLEESDYENAERLKEKTKTYLNKEKNKTSLVDLETEYNKLHPDIDIIEKIYEEKLFKFLVNMNKMLNNELKKAISNIFSNEDDNDIDIITGAHEEIIDKIQELISKLVNEINDSFCTKVFTNDQDKIGKKHI